MKSVCFNLIILKITFLIMSDGRFCDNSSIAALGMNTNFIWMWDWSTNQFPYRLGSNSYSSYVIFLKDGRLAGQSNVSTVNIWNVASGGKVDLTLNCTALALEEMYNGWLATGGNDSTLKVWDISANGTLLKNISTSASLYFIRQLTTCNFLATGDSLGNIFIYNPANNFSVYSSFAAHTDIVNMIEELPNGNIISCSFDKTVKILNITTGISLSSISPSNDIVYAVKLISPDTVVIGGVKNKIYVYMISANQLISNTTLTLPGSAVSVFDLLVTNSDLVMVAMNDGTLAVYNRTNMNLRSLYTITSVINNAVYFFAVPKVYKINVTQNTALCPSLTQMQTSTSATVNNNLSTAFTSNKNAWKSFRVVVDYTIGATYSIGVSFQTSKLLKCLIVCANNLSCKAATYDNGNNCTNYMTFPPSIGQPLSYLKGTFLYYKF